MKSIIVFASGGGSNFEVIYNNTKNNKIENSYISLLISNNPKSKAVKFAKANNIDINRKVLADLAVNNPEAFKELISKLK